MTTAKSRAARLEREIAAIAGDPAHRIAVRAGRHRGITGWNVSGRDARDRKVSLFVQTEPAARAIHALYRAMPDDAELYQRLSELLRADRRAAAAADPISIVRPALAAIRGRGRFGNRKIFIAALWREVGSQLGWSLAELKRWLVAQHRAGALELARADLVAAMDPALVAASETSAGGATFHFVVDPTATEYGS